MSIASWIASLFAGVEMSPSDLMAAIFLTAAAQSMRRKMRIRKALKPAAQMSQIEHSTQESDSSDEEDLDAGGQAPSSITIFLLSKSCMILLSCIRQFAS